MLLSKELKASYGDRCLARLGFARRAFTIHLQTVQSRLSL